MNTIVVFSTIVLLVLSSVFAAPSKPVSNNNPNKRIENLSKLVSSSPLIPLSDGNFTKFVINRPRQYYAVIMFTATNPKFQCNICLKSKALFEEAAKSYHDQNNVVTTDIDSRLFFFVLEVDNSRETFSDFQLETVPRIFILPPTTASTPKFNFHKYERENKVLLDGLPAFFDDIRDATGVEIEVTTNPAELLVVLGFIAILLSLFVSAAYKDAVEAFFWFRSPKIWVVVSSICFAVGVSGSIYCIIRSAPPYGMSRQGLALFSNQGRDQYLIEGIIVALWTIGCGASLMLLHFSTKLPFTIFQNTVAILSLAMFIVFALELWKAYTMKTQWYNIYDTMPPFLSAWFKASVKKTSSLPKRLFRLSEVWLLETKDLQVFMKKFKLLIVDYLYRVITQSK